MKKERINQYAPYLGIALVAVGLILLLDQRLRTNWLTVSIPFFLSIVILFAGFVQKKLFWLVFGFFLMGSGSILFIELQRIIQMDTHVRSGWSFLINGLSWIAIFGISWFYRKKADCWLLFVPSISIGLSANFFTGRITLLEFVLSQSLALSFVFLLWGINRKSVGLTIPGSLVSTMGVGVYGAWQHVNDIQGLKETGTMLVWFALGWLLITIISRFIMKEFIWWPLIPGGILLMVGGGLYIGGNPENTLGFLGNTGSIGLILFGVYLILLKFGLKK